MKIEIKKATIIDLEKVQELNLMLFQKEHEEYDELLNLDWTFGQVGVDYYTKRINGADGCVLLAWKDDEVVGYLCGGLKKLESCRNIPLSAEIENMFVLDKYRSGGIGTELYKEFYKWCKLKNVGKIKVEASARNAEAIMFYRKNNFSDYTLVLESGVE